MCLQLSEGFFYWGGGGGQLVAWPFAKTEGSQNFE